MRLKFRVLLVITFLPIAAFASDTVYTSVDEYPQYPGGDEAFFTYVADQLTVQLNEFDRQRIAQEDPYRIMPVFILDKQGQVDSVWLDRRSDDFLLSTYMERILYQMDTWRPGKVNGEPVPTKVYVWMDLQVFQNVVGIPFHSIFPESEVLAQQKGKKKNTALAIFAAVLTIGLFALLIQL